MDSISLPSAKSRRKLIVAAIAVLVAIAVGLGWRAEHGNRDPQLTGQKRGHGLSLLNPGCEVIYL